ncbi:MAG: 1-acyl-sn-glycerol-3-phosphate acyltransferase [Pseudomonadota bacterium]
MISNTQRVMKKTIFTTPGITHFFRFISYIILRLTGWKLTNVEVTKGLDKCVIIAAPHTSNWDFPLTIMLAFSARMPIYWIGKEEMFMFPFRSFMRWMGGIPVNRSKAQGLVDFAADTIKDSDSLYLIIAPEGTRTKVNHWKSGFYRMANTADVPILLGYIDFKKKRGGFLELFHPTGDYQKDIDVIQAKYTHISGKRPNNG